MKFSLFRSHDGAIRGGVLDGDRVNTLARAGTDGVVLHIQNGNSQPILDGSSLPLSTVTLLLPLRHHPRISGIGLNYPCARGRIQHRSPKCAHYLPETASSITGPDTDVLLPLRRYHQYGTPPGVGLGRTPQRWLQPGEEMVIEIERIGTLCNRTRAID
jgi:hypothetical protein